MKRGVLLVLLLMATVLPSHADEGLWMALKAGGKVILMRHAAVDNAHGDALLRDSSCRNERLLSAKGQSDAAYIAEQMAVHGIVIDTVLSSPYCRTMDTARRAFGKVEADPDLSLAEVLPVDEQQAQRERIKQRIAQHRGRGNLVLVTHDPNIRELSFSLLSHAEMLVLQPLRVLGDGSDEGYEELGVLRLSAK